MSMLCLADTLPAIDVLRQHFEKRQTGFDTLAEELRTVLAHLRAIQYRERAVDGSSHAVAKFLTAPPVSKTTPLHDVLSAFRPLADVLPWRYSYSPRPDLPNLENRMAWAELVGPKAPFHSDQICLGITIIGPHVHYPEHTHPAIEVYYVISGTARWTARGVTQARPPGSYILHPSNVIHAMETSDEPLIAAYTWSGEVKTLSSYTN